eukprot:1656806-Pleurochrysis_carterae.AAC.1
MPALLRNELFLRLVFARVGSARALRPGLCIRAREPLVHKPPFTLSPRSMALAGQSFAEEWLSFDSVRAPQARACFAGRGSCRGRAEIGRGL